MVRPPAVWAMVPRSAALFVILYQFRLLAADLADTAVFAGALVFAFAAAWALARRGLRPLEALAVLGLCPWAGRLFIAVPRFFIPALGGGSAGALVLDGLLLNLDRNYFVALVPFYWAAVSTFFSLRSRAFLRGDIAAADALLILIFCIARSSSMEAYRWPVLTIGLFAGVLFLQVLSLVFSLPPEFRVRKEEAIPAGVFLLLLVLGGALLFIRPSQEGAVDRGGGLLEPKLFRFDFSQFLRLESEISMNDDLVFIVRTDAAASHYLLRRYVLSAYNGKQGFFRHEELDEKAQPGRVPSRKTVLGAEALGPVSLAAQEYYLVNFDSSALIALKEAVSVSPFESWDASSFSAVYGVESLVSEAPEEALAAAGGKLPARYTQADLALGPEEFAFYTDYGKDPRIAALAEEITRGADSWWEQVDLIYGWLKFGDFRYSLKPGIAADGDQLRHFLFESKKGYCSYYAFSMALLLRSLGIPARVAAGFFVDPETSAFNYYPVRANMAHAWVEVRFPGFGWVEYDPTTQILAEGEEFRFSSGFPDVFERLMKEILENHSRLTAKEGLGEEAAPALTRWAGRALSLLRRSALPLLAAVYGIAALCLRTGLWVLSRRGRDPRKRGDRLWRHTLVRLRLAGLGKRSTETEAEWAKNLDRRVGGLAPLYPLYERAAAARFAPAYGMEDLEELEKAYRSFAAAYAQAVSPARRFLAWIVPWAALILPAKKAGLLPAAILVLLLAVGGDGAGAQNRSPNREADLLFDSALDAEDGEFWERAIELYSKGSALFPGDSRFPLALGDLYYRRDLLRLAWEEYRKAEVLLPDEPRILYQLSRTAGKLNEDRLSAGYLERLVILQPDNREAIDNLGWMYYKIHRPIEGQRLLTAAIKKFGPDPDFAMTLGTLYSALFRYEEGKRWYLEAITQWEAMNYREYAAVAHYNLSILESRFYQFDLALDRTNASLSAMNRASGRLARGELYLRQLDLGRAAAEYQAAYELDTSPLSKVNLAQVFQIGGRLEEARAYAEDCLRAGDLSWMLNYGIDPVRYRRDLHEILYKTYGGLEKTEAGTWYGTLTEKTRSLSRRISFRFKAAVHRRLFRKYSLQAAEAYEQGDAGDEGALETALQYYNAFEDYPRRALRYLREAKSLEIGRIPQAEPSYLVEEGKQLRDTALLRELPRWLDPLWERDLIAETCGELARRSRNREEVRDAAERLYALNPGALRQQGLKLPVELRITGPALSRRETAALQKTIARTGLAPIKAGTGGPETAPRYRLTLTASPDDKGLTIHCELSDELRGTALLSRTLPLRSLSSTDRSAFSRALGDAIFAGRW